jgi:putative transposase
MKYDSTVHHRRSIRFLEYDYSQAGAYFVTLCTQKRECLFGNIIAGKMQLNAAGEMIQAVWDEIPQYYCRIELDQFIIIAQSYTWNHSYHRTHVL